jgi:hypothetical protein
MWGEENVDNVALKIAGICDDAQDIPTSADEALRE